MNQEIEKLINLTIATGEITEKKRATIMHKAESLGEDLDEVELILNGELALLKRSENTIIKNESDLVKNETKVINISFYQVVMNFLNQYKLLKYSAIFFLICLAFFLFNLLIVALI